MDSHLLVSWLYERFGIVTALTDPRSLRKAPKSQYIEYTVADTRSNWPYQLG